MRWHVVGRTSRRFWPDPYTKILNSLLASLWRDKLFSHSIFVFLKIKIHRVSSCLIIICSFLHFLFLSFHDSWLLQCLASIFICSFIHAIKTFWMLFTPKCKYKGAITAFGDKNKAGGKSFPGCCESYKTYLTYMPFPKSFFYYFANVMNDPTVSLRFGNSQKTLIQICKGDKWCACGY